MLKSRIPKAITYTRVSTQEQSADAQTAELRSYCKSREWFVEAEITDQGFSGSTDKRPGLARLMTIIRSRKADVVVVSKLDRLFRSLRHLVTTVDEMTALKVAFVSVNDQLDLTTSSGRLMLQLLGAFAEFERSLIRERTVRGIAHARSIGKLIGRPKLRDDRRICELRNRGLSFLAISRELQVSKGAVCRALRVASKSPSKLDPKIEMISRVDHD